ncbi:MAG TPA: TatD family hydrolase [Spirochaetales bacterium]|nr:TatD family hydrolase [Spirochaetales bacterium]
MDIPEQASGYIDAHFHADDLSRVAPSELASYRTLGVSGIASTHDPDGWNTSLALSALHGPWLLSFGIHPQAATMEHAGFLADLAAQGALAAIGECGFDFYGDRPECSRGGDGENAQRQAFEFQLELTVRYKLPLILHMRRANDQLFRYAKRLAKLPAVILHSWNGPANEARSLLSRVPRAKFSFGTSILNGNRKAMECAATLPLGCIVSETDAPYQSPRVSAEPYAPLARSYSTFADLARIVQSIAALRESDAHAIAIAVASNFFEVFPHVI